MGFDPEHCLDRIRTLEAIAAGLELGVPTYVVAVDVGDDIFASLLDEMAIAGGRPRDGEPRYYDVRDPDTLRAALETITGELVFCRFAVPGEAEGGSVRVDGEPTDAWDATGERVELTGGACARASEPP